MLRAAFGFRCRFRAHLFSQDGVASAEVCEQAGGERVLVKNENGPRNKNKQYRFSVHFGSRTCFMFVLNGRNVPWIRKVGLCCGAVMCVLGDASSTLLRFFCPHVGDDILRCLSCSCFAQLICHVQQAVSGSPKGWAGLFHARSSSPSCGHLLH